MTVNPASQHEKTQAVTGSNSGINQEFPNIKLGATSWSLPANRKQLRLMCSVTLCPAQTTRNINEPTTAYGEQ